MEHSRTDPSQKANWAPAGCRLENACVAVPFTWAVASSTHHMTSLIQIDPFRTPLIPAQMHAFLPVFGSKMHSPTARVWLVPSVMSVSRTALFSNITPPMSKFSVKNG